MSLIDDIKRDSEAGTPGPWRLGSWGDKVFGTGPKDKWLPVCRVKRDDAPLEESADGVDARRIARVPTLENQVLRDAEIKAAAEELAEACDSVFDGIDAVGTQEFYIALSAYRKATEGEG